MKKLMITLLGAAVCCAQTLFAEDVVHVTPENPVKLTADNVDEYAGRRFEFAGGTFDLNGQSISIVSISGTDTSSLITNSAEETVTLTLTEAASDTSFAGAIAPSVTLAKTGASQTSLDVTDVGSAFVTAGTLLFPGLVDISGWTAGSRLFCVSGESPSLVFGNTCKLDSTTRPLSLALTNATLYSKKDITFGNKTTLAMLGGTWRSDYASTTWMRSGTATVENVTAEMRGSLAFDGTSSGSSSVVLKNVCGNFTNFVIGAKNGQTSNVIIEGGAITNLGSFVMGLVASSKNNLTIRGGKHRFQAYKRYAGTDPFYTYYPINFNPKGTSSSLLFEGDDTEVSFESNIALDMGDTGTTTFTVNGGKVTTCGGYFGTGGKQYLNINGGSLTMGTMSSTKGSRYITQTGGTTTYGNLSSLGSNGDFGLYLTGGAMTMDKLSLAKSNGFAAEINLEGGTLAVGTCQGGANTRFYANGGTLKPSSSTAENNDNFFSGFQSALLGEQGLTFDATYAITVAQNFTGLVDGANYGTIVKNGTGTLTLTGALCENVRLVVNKGRLVLNGSVDPTTTVTAVGSTLEINVPTTLASLTLGDGTTNGNLILGADAELIVTGEVKGSLDYSECDFVVTKDDQGRTHIVRNSSPVTTLEIRLDEEGATSNATESITFKQADTLAVSVASNATLNMSGLYKRGALTKDGAGAAVLTNPDNLLLGGVTCSAGRLAANPFSAFGLLKAVNPSLTLSGGTVEVQDDEPITYAGAFKINATNSTAAVIFKNNTDVTLRSVTHTQGALIKRGAGRLTIDPQNRATTVVLSRDKGVGALTRTKMTFDDANGSVPTTGYAGFNVAEGELCLANGTFKFDGITTKIGMPLTSEPAAPVKLTVTNATLTVKSAPGGDYSTFAVGGGLETSDYGQNISVQILDSKFSGAAFGVGAYASNEKSTSTKEVVLMGVTNSTISTALRTRNTKGTTYLRAYNSNFSYFDVEGAVEFTLDNCLYASGATAGSFTTAPAPSISGPANSWTRFTGGSRVYFNLLGGTSQLYNHTVYFDNATWYVDSSMKARWYLGDDRPITYYLKTVGDGVTISKASGTCVCSVRLEGDSGLTKTGAGTFFFDTRSKWAQNADKVYVETKCSQKFGTTTWNFTGPVDIQEGTLAVTNGAIAATMKPTVQIAEGAKWQMLGDVALTNVTVSGRGTVEGGTLTNPTIKGLWTEDGKLKEGPVFTGTVAGKVTIDLGATEEKPMPRPLPENVRVATCPNAGALSFRVTGLGAEGLRAEVKCVGNDVFCTVKKLGLMIIVM